MREIKFRAWDIARSRLIYIVGFVSCNNEIRIWYFDGEVLVNESFKPSMIIIEQFTGLYDKNGKEIYEGDIVSTEARNHGKGIEVRFHNSSWHGFYRELRFILTEGELLEEYIVIGNIHETPDLLKGANT